MAEIPKDMAVSLYATRVKMDKAKGKEYLHANPHAQELYFRGVHDTIEVIEEWAKNTPTDMLGVLLEKLYEQTDADKK